MREHSLRSLRAVFHRVLATTAVVTPVFAVGCGGKTVEPGVEGQPGFVPVSCDGESRDFVGDLSPEPPADFLEMTNEVSSPSSTGEKCAGASDRPACLAALEALPPGEIPFGPSQGSLTLFGLQMTRGDDVLAVTTRDDLVSFLAPIDTPGEAMLVAQVSGNDVECGTGGAVRTSDGFQVQALRPVGCFGRDRYLLSVSNDGAVTVLKQTRVQDPEPGCVVGRRPEGLRAPCAQRQGSVVGRYLAAAARLEAASVDAFLRLDEELRVHGAPPSLRRAARAAARDEVRHARTVAKLARRHGAVTETPVVSPMPVRDLEAIATENAVEGCVRETFGALVGRFQALHAEDRAVRRAYARIAEDELRHASLAWRVARWAEPRLDDSARRRVHAQRRRAIRALEEELTTEPHPELRQLAGAPPARTALALARALARELG